MRPYVDVSALTIVGVVTRPPRTDPRDSVLSKGQQLDTGSSPAPLGSTSDPSSGGDPTPSATATNEVEQPATREPSAGGN